MVAVQALPQIYNRFHSNQLSTSIEVSYPSGAVILSGTKTQVSLEHRKTGETLTVDIYSKIPLSLTELRSALNDAVGNHWDYKQLDIAAYDYEF